MPPQAIRVVKVGGSLLELPELADRLRGWLESQSSATNLLVVGGGRRADFVRERHADLTDREAHWLAIDAMESNARWLSKTLPEARWLDKIRDARTMDDPLGILSPSRFMWYDDVRHPAGPLPATWQVTSDSIAARAAEMAAAEELVLLKSAAAPEPATPEHLAATGYVDPFFPRASRRLPAIRYVHLCPE